MSDCTHPRSSQWDDREYNVGRCGACGAYWDTDKQEWLPFPPVEEAPEFAYIDNEHDGTLDGGDGKRWVGPWFVAHVGTEYKIPEDAGNYVSLRGQSGICEHYVQTSFGHSWALLAFTGEMVKRRWVRTCYLIDPAGTRLDMVMPDVDSATHPVTEKMAAVWSDEFKGNSGTESITGEI